MFSSSNNAVAPISVEKKLLADIKKLSELNGACLKCVEEILPYEFVDQNYSDLLLDTDVPFRVFVAEPLGDVIVDAAEVRLSRDKQIGCVLISIKLNDGRMKWLDITSIECWKRIPGITPCAGGRTQVITYTEQGTSISFSRLRGSDYVKGVIIDYMQVGE